MEFRLSNMFAFLTFTLLMARVSQAAALPPQQLYWNLVLPDTPMPKALSELVQPADLVRLPKNFVGYNPDDLYTDNLAFQKNGDDNPTGAFFFLEKDVHPGKTMKFRIGCDSSCSATTFQTRKTVESIPFSSKSLQLILNRFSVKPGSVEASIINNTLHSCETPAMRGEEKYCATSLESMIDFTTSKLGRNIQAISAEVKKGVTVMQRYTITRGVKKLGNNFIVCHKMSYPYAVFGCHSIKNTRAYMVPLEGADGTKVKAVAVCHADTSDWSPNFSAFLVLKVKPGTVPLCHFLPGGHIAWVPNHI